VIDDEPEIVELIAAYLEADGFEPIKLKPGHRLWDQMRGLSFTLLVTDILMPGIDGIELIRTLRKERPNIVIIAVSGGSGLIPASMGLHAAEALGADTVIAKPFGRQAWRQAMAVAAEKLALN
jgi:CheY-like chemotaxis protein